MAHQTRGISAAPAAAADGSSRLLEPLWIPTAPGYARAFFKPFSFNIFVLLAPSIYDRTCTLQTHFWTAINEIEMHFWTQVVNQGIAFVACQSRSRGSPYHSISN